MIDGVSELKASFALLAQNLGPAVAKAAFKGGRLVQSRVIKRIQKPQGVGQWVTRYQPGQAPYQHLASAPGQAPNSDTGELARGIQVEIVSGDVTVGVESSQDQKALGLEFGTTDGRLLPRPFLFPSLEESREDIVNMISEAVAAQVEAANRG